MGDMEIKDDNGCVHEEGEIFESECCSVEFQKETWRDKWRWKREEWKWAFQSFMIRKSLNMIRRCADTGNIIEKAKAEFKAVGYIPLDKSPEDDPNKWIQENVLDLLTVFSTQGHSGSSAPFCISYFNKLAKQEPLCPIMCTDDEWTDHTFSERDTYQNKRLSSVFKDGKDGKPYYLDAIVWKGENGCCFTGCVEEFSSSQEIKLPFTPKTFYIDVLETEWSDETEMIEKEGGGWWTSVIKDRSQLDEVFEYYNYKKLR